MSVGKKRLRISRYGRASVAASAPQGLQMCVRRQTKLDSGEILRRGCGAQGLSKTALGWYCLYCGNRVYAGQASLRELWLHFKTGREFWRITSAAGRDYINGMPFIGTVDELNRLVITDAHESAPPSWFAAFAQDNETGTACESPDAVHENDLANPCASETAEGDFRSRLKPEGGRDPSPAPAPTLFPAGEHKANHKRTPSKGALHNASRSVE